MIWTGYYMVSFIMGRDFVILLKLAGHTQHVMFFNFHNVCKDRVVYPYFMPILILSVVFGSLRHLLVILSPYSMSTVIYSHYINLSIFGPVRKVINLACG